VASDHSFSGMASRYAGAFFELARDEKAIDAVRRDLDRFDALLDENPDLLRLVRSPVFGAEERTRALASVLEHNGISGLARNFILLAASNRRSFALRQMIKAFRALVARDRGELTAEVTVAERPSEAHLSAIKDAVKSATGRPNVDLQVTVDPAIIGGLVVTVGSRRIDSSLRTKLNTIKFAMKEAR
jgi:F-type H+-transporting ATPase subunit delta